MSETIFRISPEALEERIHAAQWYRERNLGAGEKFLGELNQVFDKIFAAPHRWPRRFAGTRKAKLPTFPFLVVYRVTRDNVLIVAVVHGRREPNLLERSTVANSLSNSYFARCTFAFLF